MSKRIFSIFLILLLVGGMAYHASPDFDAEESDNTIKETVVKKNEVPDNTIVLWYTDEALEEFISDAALALKQNSDIDVRMEYIPGVDFLERINEASISDNESVAAPDLYITTHDSLMKAYLAGLANPIKDVNEVVTDNNFPTTAINAVSCDNKIVAYPLFYETNFFLYNKTYMASIAQNRIETQADLEAGNEAQAEADSKGNSENKETKTDETSTEEKSQDSDKTETKTEEGTGAENETTETGDSDATEDGDVAEGEEEPFGDEDSVADQEVLDQLATMIPSKISEVETFANNYDAPEQVEAVFKWDVTDIFYNYFFVGNYLEVGGENGDDNAVFNLYNSQAVECLKSYQGLNQYFTIESSDNYDSILQQFIDGKLVFTIATTDAFAKIEEAKLKGEFEYDYGVAILPDISDLLLVRGLSVTNAVAINGYSHKQDLANEFAAYLSYEGADPLYMKAGKLACKRGIEYENAEMNNVMTEYQKSMPLPKMIETSNFWLQLEIAFSRVWAGEEPDIVLKELAEHMGGQIDEITYSIPVQESITAGVQTFFTK